MAIELTARTKRALDELSIEPNLIIRIDGLSTLYGSTAIREFLTYGYDEVEYGDEGIFYGGLVDKEDQKQYIDSATTTYTIRQQMSYDDEAGASSVATMNIGLVDKNQEISQLISPGFDLEDILGRRVDVFYTFGDTDFFEDSIQVFKGFVTKIESRPGLIIFKINHPDAKKQVELFKSVETQLDGSITASDTTISVNDASSFFEPASPLTTYLRIGDEVVQYTGISGNDFTGVTRGAQGTTATPHDDNSQVRALYSLEDNVMDLALKLMMSGFGTDPVYEDITVTSFVKVGAGNTQIANAIYFDQVNIPQDYNITAGDTITTTGATNGANNVTTRTITDVVQFESGYYIVVDGAALVYEEDSSAAMDVFSQYNVLPDGMRMRPDEVDIEEHTRLRDFFFSAFSYRFFIKEDEINGKDFLDKEIYRPIACYSLPRKARSSVGYTIGPIPGENIKTLKLDTTRDPRNIRITRSTNRSFFNEVVYKYDDDPLVPETSFGTGLITINQTSKDRIPGRTKTYVVESKGMRTGLQGANIASLQTARILDRYKFGAEIVDLKAMFSISVDIEIGDKVVAEFDDLQVTDITQGSRLFQPRLFEVLNKTINLKNGAVDFQLLDTGINIDTRFGLMSPCSEIAGVISSSQFSIRARTGYTAKFGDDEFRNWENIISINQFISIRVHNDDYSVDEDLVVTSINENVFTLETAATITLAVGLTVEFTDYVDVDTSDKQKLLYAYMTDDASFPDTGEPYSMI